MNEPFDLPLANDNTLDHCPAPWKSFIIKLQAKAEMLNIGWDSKSMITDALKEHNAVKHDIRTEEKIEYDKRGIPCPSSLPPNFVRFETVDDYLLWVLKWQ